MFDRLGLFSFSSQLTSASILSTIDLVLARPSLAVFKSASRSSVDNWSRVRF